MTIEQHYTTAEVAALLSVSERAIWYAVSQGQLRSVKFGGLRRVPESAIQEWLDGGRGGLVVPLREARG